MQDCTPGETIQRGRPVRIISLFTSLVSRSNCLYPLQGDHDAASPCKHIDLPQTLMEPLLLRYATQNGFKCRMDTKFLSFEQDEASVTTTLKDLVTGQIQKVRSKYLMGADGARSQIVKQLGLELDVKPGGGVAHDVLVRADLSHLIKHRTGNLHWLMQPDVEYPDFGWMGVARMVKPWNEWIFSLFPSMDVKELKQPTNEEYLKRIKEFIGDDTPAEILMVSKWAINEIVAKEYSRGNVYVDFANSFVTQIDVDLLQILFRRCRSSTSAHEWSWIQHLYPGLIQPCLEDRYCAK